MAGIEETAARETQREKEWPESEHVVNDTRICTGGATVAGPRTAFLPRVASRRHAHRQQARQQFKKPAGSQIAPPASMQNSMTRIESHAGEHGGSSQVKPSFHAQHASVSMSSRQSASTPGSTSDGIAYVSVRNVQRSSRSPAVKRSPTHHAAFFFRGEHTRSSHHTSITAMQASSDETAWPPVLVSVGALPLSSPSDADSAADEEAVTDVDPGGVPPVTVDAPDAPPEPSADAVSLLATPELDAPVPATPSAAGELEHPTTSVSTSGPDRNMSTDDTCTYAGIATGAVDLGWTRWRPRRREPSSLRRFGLAPQCAGSPYMHWPSSPV